MDMWKEILTLTVDAAFFALTYSQHGFFAKTIENIQHAEKLGVNPDPQAVFESDNHTVILKGAVIPLAGEYVHGFHSPSTHGVVQKITVTEHDIANNATGYWGDNRHLIQEVTNTVPFGIRQGKYMVEVVNVKDSYVLDLDTVAAKFEPTKMSAIDNLLGFFNGVRQRGVETTEEMLKEGTIITAIGEMSLVDGVMTLNPPSDGSAYIVTVAPLTNLVKQMKNERFTMRVLCVAFGMIGLALIGCIVKHGYNFYLHKQHEKETRKRLEQIRRERRSAARTPDEDIPEAQRCVVCRANPREIILLPCGHLCLCEDCSTNITEICPMCRARINSKYAVFF